VSDMKKAAPVKSRVFFQRNEPNSLRIMAVPAARE
jgi:hypothetical protein